MLLAEFQMPLDAIRIPKALQKLEAVFTGACVWSRFDRKGSLTLLVFSLPEELG